MATTTELELKSTRNPPTPRLVYVLLLNWNNWRDTNECLSSLTQLNYDDWKVIVIDNGSTDNSVSRIRNRFPEVDIMELGENLGYAKGNNAGIRVALERGADYVWLLNNDTTVEAHALRALVERAESDPKIGAVGSAIYSASEPSRLQTWGGGRVNFWLGRAVKFADRVAEERLQYLTGASLFLRRQVVESLGLLDEEFFMYWEDADYCFRMRRSGWHLAVAEGSRVWHKEQGTIGRKSVSIDIYFNQSAVYFFKRYAFFPLVPVSISLAQRFARWLLAGDLNRVRCVWTAVTRTAFVQSSWDTRSD